MNDFEIMLYNVGCNLMARCLIVDQVSGEFDSPHPTIYPLWPNGKVSDC